MERRFSERTEQRLADDKPVSGIPKLVQVLQLPPTCVRAFHEWLATGTNNDLPEIRIIAGQLPAIATRAERVLQEAGLPIYQRSGGLVRPIIEQVDASHGGHTKIAQLKAIDPVHARDLLGRVAAWKRYNVSARCWLPADPTPAIGATILARVGEWNFPTIAGVISTPTMRPDGSLLTEPGYDPATRLLLVEPPPMPAIPDAPKREDAVEALALIEDLLTEFPFVDDVAKAVALSAIITRWCVALSRLCPCMPPGRLLPVPVSLSCSTLLLPSPSANRCRLWLLAVAKKKRKNA